MNSGHFLNSNDRNITFPYSFRNVIKLYKKVWFYSIVVFIIATAVGISSFSIGSLFRALFLLRGN